MTSTRTNLAKTAHDFVPSERTLPKAYVAITGAIKATLRPVMAPVLGACIGFATPGAMAEAASISQAAPPTTIPDPNAAFTQDLEHRTFNWFWDAANPHTGLIPDRYPSPAKAASIASVGFGLTAYGIGAERGYVTRQQALDRTLLTLRFLASLPQNAAPSGASGYHGFFYHFLNAETGLRFADWSELSSVDTALLMSGILFSQSYFDRDTQAEREVRSLADQLYRRVDWQWMEPQKKQWLSMGWSPAGQFIASEWKGYDEGMIIYLLALGSPTHPLPAETWHRLTESYSGQWGAFESETLLNFAPLFGHQYSESWVDFRGIHDDWNRSHGLDYFQNSRKAAYSQQAYAISNPGRWHDYGATVWGLTACDGPGDAHQQVDGSDRHFLAYSARGAGRDYILDDGTIAPTAAGGSIAFAPEIALPSLEAMHNRYGDRIYNRYGFVDAFNPSFKAGDGFWADTEQLGIDQGPIILMIENWRDQLVWNVMKRNAYLRNGLERAGFRDGWLASTRHDG